MIKNMTVSEIKKMFKLLPNPEQHIRDRGFHTPYEVDVKGRIHDLTRAEPEARCHEVVETVRFKVVETDYGLDWQIV